MGEKKPDRRVAKTKKAIHNAFAKLLSQKELNDITIKDIADLADINRKTFYNYYSGVYAVIDEIENEIINALEKTLEEIDFQDALNNPYPIFKKFTDIINSDLDFYGHLLSMQGNVSLITKTRNLMKQKMRAAVTAQLPIDGSLADIMLDYTFSGMMTTYQNWFNSGRRQSLEQISAVLSVLCFNGTNGLIEKSKAMNLSDEKLS